jgi:6-pyruvoyltetrahydropterin/6-carboxytetrahydropterin synthase
MENTKIFRFEASHILPKHKGKCSRLHGHSWVLEVTVFGDVDEETGFVMDFAEISDILAPFIENLDHHHLGTWTDVDGWLPYNAEWAAATPEDFYPTSENLLLWMASKFEKCGLRGKWSRLKLNETCTSSCMLTRKDYERTVRRRSESMATAQ